MLNISLKILSNFRDILSKFSSLTEESKENLGGKHCDNCTESKYYWIRNEKNSCK